MRSIKNTSFRELGALLKYEANIDHCRSAGSISAPADADLVVQPGTLLTGGATPEVFDTAAPADVTGICVTAVYIPAGQSSPIAWIDRGPVTLNSNEMDFPADTDQRAAIEANIADMGNIKLVAGS